MPVYQYVCDRCKKTYDDIKPFNESDVLTPCPECGKTDKVRKDWDTVPVFFNGNGYTRTNVGQAKKTIGKNK